MHISSREPSVVRHFVHKLYLIMVSSILLGIVVEGVLISPSLFATTNFGRPVHGDLGALLLGLSRMPGRLTLLSTVLFALTLIQAISAALGRRFLVLAALHPANALLMAGLTVWLLLQAWHLMRQGSGEMNTRRGSPL
jgi:hypothetical protein